MEDSQTCIPEQHWFERPDPMELFCDPAVWDAESVKDILSFGLTANSAATSTSAAVSNGSAREPAGVDTYLGPSVFFRKCGTRYEFN